MNQEELNNRLQEIEDKLTAVEQPADNRIWFTCEAENSYEINKFTIVSKFSIIMRMMKPAV
jgi:hypothetical protein